MQYMWARSRCKNINIIFKSQLVLIFINTLVYQKGLYFPSPLDDRYQIKRFGQIILYCIVISNHIFSLFNIYKKGSTYKVKGPLLHIIIHFHILFGNQSIGCLGSHVNIYSAAIFYRIVVESFLYRTEPLVTYSDTPVLPECFFSAIHISTYVGTDELSQIETVT